MTAKNLLIKSLPGFLVFFVFGMLTNVSAQKFESGKFILYKYQKALGTEVFKIKPEEATLVLDTEFELNFVGSQVLLKTSLRLKGDTLSPLSFYTKGMTSTRTNVDTSVVVANKQTTTIQHNSQISSVKTPDKFFTLLHPAPVAPQMMLFRYWKKNKIKGKIPLLPGGNAEIVFLGTDKITTSEGKTLELERYAFDGVMWGREIVWFDQDQNLIALIGADAEMDRFEAVREGFEDSLSFFVKRAAEDSVKQLKDLSREIKPLYQGKFAIVGGFLIGGKDFQTIGKSVIIIENGKVKQVGSTEEVKIPKGVKVFDATGKTILPGLFDMHGHATQAEWFPASLAAGITTMRDAANEIEFIVPVRDGEKNGEINVSPRLLLAGYIDSGETSVGSMRADTPEEALKIVRQYKQAGFQQIKIYQSFRPELVRVVADEAHKLGMTITGHIPTGMDIYRAVEDGYDQVNHLGFIFPVMTPRNPAPGQPRNLDPETETAREGFKFLKENKIIVEPTLARAEIGSKVLGDSFAKVEPGAAKLPFEFAALIESMGLPSGMAAQRQSRMNLSLRVLKALHEAGVPLVVGTDLVVPGHTEYRELELFVRAGISPLEAIKSATIVPARAMGLDRELGSVEPGKIADLILVDGNPLESISEIRKVRFVIKNGQLFDTAPLWQSVNFQP